MAVWQTGILKSRLLNSVKGGKEKGGWERERETERGKAQGKNLSSDWRVKTLSVCYLQG